MIGNSNAKERMMASVMKGNAIQKIPDNKKTGAHQRSNQSGLLHT